MSLLCRLKNLVHKGMLKEKDLERIIIIQEGATVGDTIKAVFPNIPLDENDFLVRKSRHDNTKYWKEWWNSPYRKEQE